MSRRAPNSPSAAFAASPFDAMAAEYDDAFTNSTIGRLLRMRVWERLDACFRPGDHVLEINCGTGVDAIHLARRGVYVTASDASRGMLASAQANVARAGVADRVNIIHFDLNHVAGARVAPTFDGLLSNFGGLNCVDDLRTLAAHLAGVLRPAAPAVFGVMGPLVPWEWAWYLRRGDLRRAGRRLRPGGTPWRGLTIRYPSIGALQRAFSPWFRVQRVAALGVLVPPSYAEAWAARHPALIWAFDRLERLGATLPPFPQLGDHYLFECIRTDV